MCSALGVFSALGVYHQCSGHVQCVGECSVFWGDIIGALGDIMICVQEYHQCTGGSSEHSEEGGYHQVIRGCSMHWCITATH